MRVIFPLWLLIVLAGPIQNGFGQVSAETRIKAIQGAYDKLEFDEAELLIRSALDDFSQFSPSQLSQVYVLQAYIHFAKNNMNDAESSLLQALQLRPELELDALNTPPRMLDIFTTLKQSQIDANPGTPLTQSEVRYLVVQDQRADAAIRSMIVPGWGQYYKGERGKGTVLVGLWVATAGGTAVSHVNRNQARDRYLRSTTSAEVLDRFGRYSTWHKVRNNLFWGAVGVWLYSYLDAILTEAPLQMIYQEQSRLDLSLKPTPDAVQFTFTWSL